MKDKFMLCRAGLVIIGVILFIKSIFFVFLAEEKPDFPMIALLISALPAIFMIISGLYINNTFRKVTIGVMGFFLLMSIVALIQVRSFEGGLIINMLIFAIPIFILTREAYKFYCVQ